MIDIEELKPKIVERLLPLRPDKIILFGSYAYGSPTEDSDIDLFLFKKAKIYFSVFSNFIESQML